MAKKKEGFRLLKHTQDDLLGSLKEEILLQGGGDPEVTYSLGIIRDDTRQGVLVLCRGAEEFVPDSGLKLNIETGRLKSFVEGLLHRLSRPYHQKLDYKRTDGLRTTLGSLRWVMRTAFGVEAEQETFDAFFKSMEGVFLKAQDGTLMTCGQYGYLIRLYEEQLVRELAISMEAEKA